MIDDFSYRVDTSWKNRLAASVSKGRLCVSSRVCNSRCSAVLISPHAAIELVCYPSFKAPHSLVVGAPGCDQTAVVLAAALAIVADLL